MPAPKPRSRKLVRRDYRDRDPVLDEVCRMITDSGVSTGAIVRRIARLSAGYVLIASSTLDRWLTDKTMRPQNYTIEWVTFALGRRRIWEWFDVDELLASKTKVYGSGVLTSKTKVKGK